MKTQVIIIAVSILLTGCVGSKKRDTISFESSITEISDAIFYLNKHLDHLNKANYYLDAGGILRIDNVVIGKLDESFLDLKNLKESGYSEIDLELFKTILFLNENGINACFKHRDLDLLVYDYRPTEKNEFEDIRYIVYSEKGEANFSSQLYEYAYVLDHKENLYLIALNE